MTSAADSETGTARDDRPRLVIVESPAKARTIAQFLGPDFVVEASIGHVRDLPSNAAEIPARYKKEPWARIGVDVDHDFQPLYIIPAAKRAQVKKLKDLLAQSSELYLATDEDREGEAIAWHLEQVLSPPMAAKRMVFHEITRAAIEEALANTREIDAELVAAQEARRILDRLYGYEVSPVLWRKIQPRLSAGRVQSVALSMIVERERARMRFVVASYWDVDASLRPANDTRAAEAVAVSARLAELGGKRVATGRDFDAERGTLHENGSVALLDRATAESVAASLAESTATVVELNERPYTQRPPAPFITSTLQQEAARKLRFGAQRTMRVAQALYENGHITYMRTDSTQLSSEAVNAARRQASERYGGEFVPERPRRYATSKGAQEAHEAIRPAGDAFRTAEELRAELDTDDFRLYDLIWKRTVASQMRDATGLRTSVRLEAAAGEHGTAVLTASGKVITFAGFLRAYVEGADDPEEELGDQERILPPLAEGQRLAVESTEARGHETQPPARFTEASLVREMEERGIGRPSTYAATIQTVQDRGYVSRKGTALVPSFVAFAVVQLLERHFPELVNPSFTARMEERLDAVAAGTVKALPWLRDFYFGGGEGTVDEDVRGMGLRRRIAEGWEEIDAREVCSIPLGEDADGRAVVVRVGRFGPYVEAGDDGLRAQAPDDIAPDELTLERALALLKDAAREDEVLGYDPESEQPVYLKTGPYGPYVQLGEGDASGDERPRRGSLWSGMTLETATLDDALLVLSFPKTLGAHPESGVDVTAQDGPNGPYLRMGSETRNLEDHEHMKRVTLEDALALFAQPKAGRRGPAEIASLGEHPESGEPVRVLKGRYGPYVTDGAINANVPKGRDPATVTLEEAVEMLAARAQKMREQGTKPKTRRRSGGKSSRRRST